MFRVILDIGDIEDGIDSTGKKMTLCQLYAKQNLQRANVKKSTQKQREQLMRLLKEDKLGARSIDTIKPSDAKEWALRMKDKGFSYNTINNHKRSLKASFSCLCCRYRPQYPVLSAVPVHEVRVFPVFPLVSGLWVSISKHTHILCFQMRLHIYISISRLFVGSLQYAGYVLYYPVFFLSWCLLLSLLERALI
jgi:hypothetical protein